MVKILIADDHPIVRTGLKQIIADTDDLVVAGEAATGQEVLDKVSKSDFDVILLDITMPGGGGIDILKKLKILKPGLPVLIISIHPEKQYAARMFKLGISGYLTKDRAPDEIVEVIRRVSRGEKYISSSLAEILGSSYEDNTAKQLHETLSDREYEVMRLIASGKTVKEIARELSLSIKTVHTHRSRILGKMLMEKDSDLIHYALENNLLD